MIREGKDWGSGKNMDEQKADSWRVCNWKGTSFLVRLNKGRAIPEKSLIKWQEKLQNQERPGPA